MNDQAIEMGFLQPLMDDPLVEELIINGPQRVFVIRKGQKEWVRNLTYADSDLRELLRSLLTPLGRQLDDESPMVDARLPDGSRLNAAIPPVTLRWCCVTIRKFILRAHSLDQLVGLGTLTDSAARFLDAAVRGGMNMLVSGPTGAGKTTMLNVLGASIASLDERVICVEETPELQLEDYLPDCVALHGRMATGAGGNEIRIRDLVRNALRMRPTRIIVGEVRGAEALDMLLAMNTGHEGSLTTIHGNSPRDAIDRLGALAQMAEERLSGDALTRMVARTIDIVLQLRSEPRSGRRRLVGIFEVTGVEGSSGGLPIITGQDLWVLDPGTDTLVWTGLQPRCLGKIAAKGITYTLPPASEARSTRGIGVRAGGGHR